MQMDLFGYERKEPEKQASSCFGKDKVVTLRGDEIFLTPKELAARIGFHLQSVYAWKRNRGMPVRQSTSHGRWTVEWHEFCQWWKEPKK